jgi:magnesium-transporting ATPase (P-type)
MTIKSQKDLVSEFMKILSLAHSCEVEKFTDKDGNSQKFYNGPSPDEVALVEYASSMKFDCLSSTEEIINMAMHGG